MAIFKFHALLQTYSQTIVSSGGAPELHTDLSSTGLREGEEVLGCTGDIDTVSLPAGYSQYCPVPCDIFRKRRFVEP